MQILGGSLVVGAVLTLLTLVYFMFMRTEPVCIKWGGKCRTDSLQNACSNALARGRSSPYAKKACKGFFGGKFMIVFMCFISALLIGNAVFLFITPRTIQADSAALRSSSSQGGWWSCPKCPTRTTYVAPSYNPSRSERERQRRQRRLRRKRRRRRRRNRRKRARAA